MRLIKYACTITIMRHCEPSQYMCYMEIGNNWLIVKVVDNNVAPRNNYGSFNLTTPVYEIDLYWFVR